MNFTHIDTIDRPSYSHVPLSGRVLSLFSGPALARSPRGADRSLGNPYPIPPPFARICLWTSFLLPGAPNPVLARFALCEEARGHDWTAHCGGTSRWEGT